jgi:hypothetical protein
VLKCPVYLLGYSLTRKVFRNSLNKKRLVLVSKTPPHEKKLYRIE